MATTSSQLQLDPRHLMQSSAYSGLTPVDIPTNYDGLPPPYDDSNARSIPNSATTGDKPIIGTQPTNTDNNRGKVLYCWL